MSVLLPDVGISLLLCLIVSLLSLVEEEADGNYPSGTKVSVPCPA
jgi:hypothetical protein